MVRCGGARMITLTKSEFRSRILKSQERRKEGKRQATAHYQENFYKTREKAYLARHVNQSAY